MKIVFRIFIGLLLLSALSVYPLYKAAEFFFNHHFSTWGDKLIELENKGLLSRQFGAAWKDVLAGDEMAQTGTDDESVLPEQQDTGRIINGVRIADYPSLSIVSRLNEIREYSNTIDVKDRKSRIIARIRTDHTRAKIKEFPKTLITSLIASEDSRFYDNKLGFEFRSFVRAALNAGKEGIKTFSISTPKGTSTITQQVAKLFISQLDETGQRMVSRSLDRKVQELRLSAAIRKLYPADDVLEVYLNHCIASDFGLIGVKDIAKGLLGKNLSQLSDAECVYISRMVKWGRNVTPKIRRQCRIDMPRIAAALNWDAQKQAQVIAEIDSLTFEKPKQIDTDYGHLVDLANEFWLKFYRKQYGIDSITVKDMDLIDPNSLIRRKGNMTIQTTIDLPLQKFLENLVNNRGFGKDTTIFTDFRIGSFGEDVSRSKTPTDTIRYLRVIDTPRPFSEMNSSYQIFLQAGDTLVTNIRYHKKSKSLWRRSVFYYTRKLTKVNGQYFAYCLLDAATGKILAYYSHDQLGSRLACLLRNKTPNGSSTAKPILYALNYDMGLFPPYAKWSDRFAVTDDVPWKRYVITKDNEPYEVVFEHGSIPGIGYRIHNHNYDFYGCQYIFEHLNLSNNIFCVEAIYRLNRTIFDQGQNIAADAFPFAQFLYRINAFDRLKSRFTGKAITGVRLYKELAGLVGVDIDTMVSFGKRVGISDSLYSIALGTLELTLLEQAHIFNMLHGNNLIERPADHPSLVIDSITMQGRVFTLADNDTVMRYHPFSDLNTIRPALLGLHKRLTGSPADGLQGYDIAYDAANSGSTSADSAFDVNAFLVDDALSNIAKSGTTDDVLRPFNADVTTKKRTNYGLWNATIRIDLSKFSNDPEPDIRDVTLACIAECNEAYTGARDGKSLHKYVSRDLLKTGGIPQEQGFFGLYEEYIQRMTPDSASFCKEPAQMATQTHPIEALPADSTEDLGDIW